MNRHELWLPRSNNPPAKIADLSPTLPNKMRQRIYYLLSVATPHTNTPSEGYTALRTLGARGEDNTIIFDKKDTLLTPTRLPVAVVRKTPSGEDDPDAYELLSCTLHTRTGDGQFSFQYDFGHKNQRQGIITLNSPTRSYLGNEIPRIPAKVKEIFNNVFARDLWGTTLFSRTQPDGFL